MNLLLFSILSTTVVVTTNKSVFMTVYAMEHSKKMNSSIMYRYYNTQVLEENYYYPYGLTLSTTAMGGTEQKYKYQGVELEKSFGLETYETNYRRLDPQLGRFMQIDPLANYFTYQSPYASMDNNPVSNTDPDGLFSRFGAWWRNIVWDGNGISKNSKTGEWGVQTNGTDWDGTAMVQMTYKGNPYAFPNQIREHYIEQMELKQFWEESGFETKWVDTKEEQVVDFIQFHGSLMINTAPQLSVAKSAATANTEIDATAFAEEIISINKATEGGGVLLNSNPVTAINSAMYYEKTAEQGAAIFRSISHGHMFLDGNKRTAIATFVSFAEKMGLKTVSVQKMQKLATQVAEGKITDVSKIAKKLTK